MLGHDGSLISTVYFANSFFIQRMRKKNRQFRLPLLVFYFKKSLKNPIKIVHWIWKFLLVHQKDRMTDIDQLTKNYFRVFKKSTTHKPLEPIWYVVFLKANISLKYQKISRNFLHFLPFKCEQLKLTDSIDILCNFEFVRVWMQ